MKRRELSAVQSAVCPPAGGRDTWRDGPLPGPAALTRLGKGGERRRRGQRAGVAGLEGSPAPHPFHPHRIPLALDASHPPSARPPPPGLPSSLALPPQTAAQISNKTCFSLKFFLFFPCIFFVIFYFFVKCPGSSITYKHDLYRGVDGKAGRGGVTGDAPLLAAPLGLGPFGHFGGTGTPQHLPEVVWPPLPLVLRIL